MNAVTMYSYTEKEIKTLLDSMIIQIDTREQQNSHITDYLDKKQVQYAVKKLNFGDYSCYLPKNEQLGIMRDMYFPMVIERKNSIDELAATIKERTRFENELIRSQRSNFLLLVEDAAGYENIIRGNYRSEYNPKALLASLKAFESRYGFQTVFIGRELTGNYIFHHFYYALREMLG